MILCAVAGVCEILQQFLLFVLRGSLKTRGQQVPPLRKKENCPEASRGSLKKSAQP